MRMPPQGTVAMSQASNAAPQMLASWPCNAAPSSAMFNA
jgi:hypothetical protein